MNPPPRAPKDLTTHCPSCNSKATVIRTEKMSGSLMVKTFQCTNRTCRGLFKANISFSDWVLPPIQNNTEKGTIA